MATRSPGQLSVLWTSPIYAEGETLQASFQYRDPEGIPYRNLQWKLYRNNVVVRTGIGMTVTYSGCLFGTYRLIATVTDAGANTIECDSSVQVTGSFEIQATIVPEQPVSAVLLGQIYCPAVEIRDGTATYFPFPIQTTHHEVYLVPGTTHYKLFLTTERGVADKEIVARTQHGNFTLLGPPAGLYDEAIGYDYQPDQPLIPAPKDLKLHIALDTFKVSGSSISAYAGYVGIKCYRSCSQLYKYTSCAYSNFPGGEGPRYRKFCFLFTNVDAEYDIENSDTHPTGMTAVQSYSLVDITESPAYLTPDGSPNPIQYQQRFSFTDSNILTYFEPYGEGLPELEVKAVSAIPDVRPFVMTSLVNTVPPKVVRMKRLSGKIVAYMANGAINSGAVIRARIETGNGIYEVPITISADNQSPDEHTFVRIGDASIDLSDYQFGFGSGLAINVNLSEGSNSATILPDYEPAAEPGPSSIYTTTYAKAVSFDGACYSSPVAVSLFEDGNIVPTSGLNGCYATACGPHGIYCYTNLDSGSTIWVQQPLHYPANFIAYGTDLANCYGSPALVEEDGTITTPVIVGFTGTSNCGFAAAYNACSTAETSLAIIYPWSTSAHDYVLYSGTCWAFTGTITDTTNYSLVDRNDVTPVVDCSDTDCTHADPSGNSVAYLDTETQTYVNIKFNHLDVGIPFYGVDTGATDSGVALLPSGSAQISIVKRPRVTVVSAYPGTGTVEFKLTGEIVKAHKKLIRKRGTTETVYALAPGNATQQISIVAGDDIIVDGGNDFGRVKTPIGGGIEWKPVISLPRKYREIPWDFSSPSKILAVGFCGLTPRTDYTFYGTLPADVTMSMPNPDSFVTIQGVTGPELILVRAKSETDVVYSNGLAFYNGETLTGPYTFRFYAARANYGAHGEMDVWLEIDDNFPQYFSVSPYKALSRPAGFYRREDSVSDVSRNSLRVIGDPTIYQSPAVYIASDGQVILSDVYPAPSQISYASKVFTHSGSYAGLAYDIVPEADVTSA